MLDEMRHGPAGDAEDDGVPVGIRIDLSIRQQKPTRASLATGVDQVLTWIPVSVHQHHHRACAVGDHRQQLAMLILEPGLLACPVKPMAQQRSRLCAGVRVIGCTTT